jgi:hypothetical protein
MPSVSLSSRPGPRASTLAPSRPDVSAFTPSLIARVQTPPQCPTDAAHASTQGPRARHDRGQLVLRRLPPRAGDSHRLSTTTSTALTPSDNIARVLPDTSSVALSTAQA